MSEVITLEAQSRSQLGTGPTRELRRNSKLPIEIYGDGKENIHAALEKRVVDKAIEGGGFYTKLFDINVDGKKERVLPKQVEFHPVTDQPIHIDFIRVNKDSRVDVYVPLHFENEAGSPGLKRGGVLNAVLHDLEVSCAASAIPEFITVDLTGLDMHHTIHLKDIKLPKGVELIGRSGDPEMTIATVMATSSVRSEEAAAKGGEEGAAEGEGETEAGTEAEAEAEKTPAEE